VRRGQLLLGVGLWLRARSDRQRPQPRECRGQCLGPRPGARQSQGDAPAGAGDPPGDVQQALAQPLGLGKGECAIQAEGASP
jgi:hypothetical protein